MGYDTPPVEYPYHHIASTGLYIDTKWSGYQTYYDNDKYCVAGIVKKFNQTVREEYFTKDYISPYRNVFEIFEHSGFQIRDIGNHRFWLESGYKDGQPIGYNQIFFQSGLNPSGVSDYNILLVPNRRMSDYDRRLSRIGKSFIGYNESLNEPHNVIRYHVFFYSGSLPVVYLTGENNKINRGFGFGPVYQHKNPKYKSLVNQNYKIVSSGIHGERTIKEFSIFNTGNITERFYIGIDNPLFTIKQNKIPGLPMHGVWTNENQYGKKYGEIIDKVYKIGRESNLNFKIELNTHGLTGDLVNRGNINIYRITGNFNCFSENFPSSFVRPTKSHRYGKHYIKNLGYLSEKYSIPIEIYPKTNGTKIISDNIFFQNLADGDYKPIFKVGQPINVNPDDKQHYNLNDSIGLTFYSVGSNVRDLSVRLDTLAKIKRKNIEIDQA